VPVFESLPHSNFIVVAATKTVILMTKFCVLLAKGSRFLSLFFCKYCSYMITAVVPRVEKVLNVECIGTVRQIRDSSL
jgi:hypothetical protein